MLVDTLGPSLVGVSFTHEGKGHHPWLLNRKFNGPWLFATITASLPQNCFPECASKEA